MSKLGARKAGSAATATFPDSFVGDGLLPDSFVFSFFFVRAAIWRSATDDWVESVSVFSVALPAACAPLLAVRSALSATCVAPLATLLAALLSSEFVEVACSAAALPVLPPAALLAGAFVSVASRTTSLTAPTVSDAFLTADCAASFAPSTASVACSDSVVVSVAVVFEPASAVAPPDARSSSPDAVSSDASAVLVVSSVAAGAAVSDAAVARYPMWQVPRYPMRQVLGCPWIAESTCCQRF